MIVLCNYHSTLMHTGKYSTSCFCAQFHVGLASNLHFLEPYSVSVFPCKPNYGGNRDIYLHYKAFTNTCPHEMISSGVFQHTQHTVSLWSTSLENEIFKCIFFTKPVK